MLQQKAEHQSEATNSAGASLERFVRFIDCTKNMTYRFTGQSCYQKGTYFGHKRVPRHIYQTTTTTTELTFCLFGLKESRRRDPALPYSIWYDFGCNPLFIHRTYYNIYENLINLPRPWVQRLFLQKVFFSSENMQNKKIRVFRSF